MRNRDRTIIFWEILKALAAGPLNPTRLARRANVPYDRLDEYLGSLKSGGLVRVESAEGHALFSITPTGMEALGHLDEGLKMLFPLFR
ncbi:MAG: hypothetical protein JRN06_11420 [Nitrososphaerota archaeon]|nr:hypothetical protein [Nitrososphaerota archaeon]MDG7024707.1 hypothetical protein [Nitrososphaerota archaeon]